MVVYGLIENRGEEKLKCMRFLHPGQITYIKDMSPEWMPPNTGPDPHWRTKVLEKLSGKMTTLSVQYPYPQGYLFLKGGPKFSKHIGTLAKSHELETIYPPKPLEKEDFDFRRVFQKGDLVFSKDKKLVETTDKKLFIQLAQLTSTEISCPVDLDPGEARFFAYEFFAPRRAVLQTEDMYQWNAYGPGCFLSRLATEVSRMMAYSKDFDSRMDSRLRFSQFVNRIRGGMCPIEKFWVSILFEGSYYSSENTPPLAVYFHTEDSETLEYQSKTWIFDDTDFYIVTSVFALPKIKFSPNPMDST